MISGISQASQQYKTLIIVFPTGIDKEKVRSSGECKHIILRSFTKGSSIFQQEYREYARGRG